MFAALFLALSVPAEPSGLVVRLEDADRFHVQPAMCRHYWRAASTHVLEMRAVVCGGWNNPPEVCAAWEKDCAWRARCWYLLDDVIYCDITPSKKLQSLDQLRRLIGDEAYFAGVMPDPTPPYRRP